MRMNGKNCPVCDDPVYVTSQGRIMCENCTMLIARPSSAQTKKINGMKKYFCKRKCMNAFLKTSEVGV